MRLEIESAPEEKQEPEAVPEKSPKKKSRKESFKEEWTKFKGLPFSDKFWYIWEYYKFHLLGVLVAFVFIGMFIQAFIQGSKPVILEGAVVDVEYKNVAAEYLKEEYITALGYEPKEVNMSLDANMSVASSAAIDTQTATVMKLIALIQSNSLDFMLAGNAALEYFTRDFYYQDLSQFLPAEEFARLESEGRIVYHDIPIKDSPNDDEPSSYENRAVAVRMNGTNADNELGFLEEDVYFCVISGSKRPDETLKYLNYLLTGEAEPEADVKNPSK